MNYTLIKQAAADNAVSYRDLIVLAPQNDPFYVGTPTDLAQAQWFADVWQRAGYGSGVHLRRVHYWCVSQPDMAMHNGNPYENTDRCWKYLCQASKVARYLAYVDAADIADNKNPEPTVNADYWYSNDPWHDVNAPDLDDLTVKVGGISDTYAQPYHLEVWCEKSTMNDVLEPVCRRYGANLATFEGEASVTAVLELVNRIAEAEKPARVFYISDFDPAGQSMPVATARKLEFWLQQAGIGDDVRLMPLLLTAEQVRQYQLPRTPIKDSELRAGHFEDVHGAGAVELDALEALQPGEMGRIVSEALGTFYSEEARRAARDLQQALREAVQKQVDEITGRYGEEIDAIRGMLEEIRAIRVMTSQYEQERMPPSADDDGLPWLFDSGRDYFDQVGHYKDFQGK